MRAPTRSGQLRLPQHHDDTPTNHDAELTSATTRPNPRKRTIINGNELERKAQICADLFQRSSSCVEGRNGQLSLKHHALHRFTLRKLQALTVLHNYLIRRSDGTTAAERFYGTVPRDLFAWLLNRMSVPARPRAHRRAA